MHRAPELGLGLPPSLWSQCRTSLGFGSQRRAGQSLALFAPVSAPSPARPAGPSAPIPPCCRREGGGLAGRQRSHPGPRAAPAPPRPPSGRSGPAASDPRPGRASGRVPPPPPPMRPRFTPSAARSAVRGII